MLARSGTRLRLEHRVVRRCNTKAPGAPLHAVDAQEHVQHAADDRRQPGEADPRNGRAGIAVVREHVQGDAGGKRKMDDRKADRRERNELCRHCFPPRADISKPAALSPPSAVIYAHATRRRRALWTVQNTASHNGAYVYIPRSALPYRPRS